MVTGKSEKLAFNDEQSQKSLSVPDEKHRHRMEARCYCIDIHLPLLIINS